MASLRDWQIAPARQPKPGDYPFDLDPVLGAVVGIHSIVPEDAFTAETLGTERAGNGIFIREGVILTIGYLITEAETIWVSLSDGTVVPGHPLAYDQETGFGLVQVLAHVDLPPIKLGFSGAHQPGTRVVMAGAGGRKHSVAAWIVAKQEFAGYWEYVLDEAIFTAPAHPFWGGAALIGPQGDLLGIGSLQVEQRSENGEGAHLNMVVPIDLLRAILEDMLTTGRPNKPPRPWLGVFATELEGKVFVAGVASGGPAERAGLKAADLLVSVAGSEVTGLANLFRRIWALGSAGVEVPLIVHRDGRTFQLTVPSGDRNTFLKAPKLHS